jgi:hypothetical protein
MKLGSSVVDQKFTPNSVLSLRARRSNLDERMLYLPEIASSAYGLLAMT